MFVSFYALHLLLYFHCFHCFQCFLKSQSRRARLSCSPQSITNTKLQRYKHIFCIFACFYKLCLFAFSLFSQVTVTVSICPWIQICVSPKQSSCCASEKEAKTIQKLYKYKTNITTINNLQNKTVAVSVRENQLCPNHTRDKLFPDPLLHKDLLKRFFSCQITLLHYNGRGARCLVF